MTEELNTNDKIKYMDSIKKMGDDLFNIIDHIQRIDSVISRASKGKWKQDEDGVHFKKIKNKTKKKDEEVEVYGENTTHEIYTHKLKREIYQSKKVLNKMVEDLFVLSEKDNYYWRNCSLKTYKNHLDTFQNNFFNLIPEAELINFLEHELKYLTDKACSPNFNHKTELPDYFPRDLSEYLFDKNLLKVNLSNKQKIDFIISDIEKLGFGVNQENNFKVDKKNSFDPTPTEEPLKLKGLPDFDTLDRFQLIKKLGIDSIIHNLDTSQSSKNKVLALIMKIHPDNARKLMANKYPKLKSTDEIKTLCNQADENVNIFFNNPLNKIKIP